MWDRINHGTPVEDCRELFDDICKLAVLSNVEIDRAKREFVLNSMTEINIIKEKYKIEDDNKTVKPMAFKVITTENGYKLSNNIKYKYFDTSFDFLQKIISKFNFYESREYKDKLLPFTEILVDAPDSYRQGFYYVKKDQLIEYVRNAKNTIKARYIGYDEKDKSEKEEVREAVADIKESLVNYINDYFKSPKMMYIVLLKLESPENKDISRFMFETFFANANSQFFSLIKESKDNVYTLIEDENGDIEFYGMKFSKVKVNNGLS